MEEGTEGKRRYGKDLVNPWEKMRPCRSNHPAPSRINKEQPFANNAQAQQAGKNISERNAIPRKTTGHHRQTRRGGLGP